MAIRMRITKDSFLGLYFGEYKNYFGMWQRCTPDYTTESQVGREMRKFIDDPSLLEDTRYFTVRWYE